MIEFLYHPILYYTLDLGLKACDSLLLGLKYEPQPPESDIGISNDF